MWDTAPALRVVIDNDLKRSGIAIKPIHEVDNRDGNVFDRIDAGSRTLAGLRTEFSPLVCNESSSQGRYPDDRSALWLQKVERVSHPKAFAF